MGYDLYTVDESKSDKEDDNYFRWNIWGWSPILVLAAKYGWKPLGTEVLAMSEEEAKEHDISDEDYAIHCKEVVDWDGHYDSNSGQVVTEKDASNMAKALEDALDDIPDFEVPIPGANKDGSVSLGKDNEKYKKHRSGVISGAQHALAIEFSGKESKDYIRKFISFLRLGAFHIH